MTATYGTTFSTGTYFWWRLDDSGRYWIDAPADTARNAGYNGA